MLKRPPSLVAIILLALAIWGGEYLRRDLWEPDEARYAYIAREMRADHHWAVPHRHGEYYAHKPPLIFWLSNAATMLVSDGDVGRRVAARMPSLLGAILSLWAIAGLARRWGDAATAWRAVLITSSCYLFWAKSGMGQIDALLCGLEMLALYHLVAFEHDRRLWRPLTAYAAMGLAVLAKGPVGFAVPFGMYIAGAFAVRDHQRRLYAHYAWGPLLTLLFPVAWLAWALHSGAPEGYFQELLFKQNVGRAAGEMGHVKPLYFYIENFIPEFLPWTPFWLFIWPAYRAADPVRRAAMRRLLAWIAFVLVFFSLSPSKRELYILPAYPPTALLVAMAWPCIAQSKSRAAGRYLWGFLGFAGLAVLGTALTDAIAGLIPLRALVLVPTGLIALVGAWAVRRAVTRSGGAATDPVFFTFAAAMLAVLVSVSTVVYPAVNPLKAPYAVAAAAERYLAPTDPVFLYRMNGEIMALYARRPGRCIASPTSLESALRTRGHGLVVMEAKEWPEMPEDIVKHAVWQNFRMGGKRIVWAHVDFRDQPPAASSP